MGDFIEKAFWDCYDYLGEIFYQDYKGQQMQDYVTYFVMSLCTLSPGLFFFDFTQKNFFQTK